MIILNKIIRILEIIIISLTIAFNLFLIYLVLTSPVDWFTTYIVILDLCKSLIVLLGSLAVIYAEFSRWLPLVMYGIAVSAIGNISEHVTVTLS